MALIGSEASLLEEGVVFLEDPDVGKRSTDFVKKDFLLEDGLDLCRMSTIEDKRVRGLIESIFERSSLGLLKVYGPKPDTVFSFLNNTLYESGYETNQGKDKVRALLVQILPKDSKIVFYRRSHLQSLRARGGKFGLLEVPQESLDKDDINPMEVTMEEGGLAIIDGRLGFRMVQGITVIVGFAVDDELRHWTKMKIPNETGLMQKVKDMESEKIGINVEFVNKERKNDLIASIQPQK